MSAKKENKALVSLPLWEEKMEKDYFCCLVAVIELPYEKTIVARPKKMPEHVNLLIIL